MSKASDLLARADILLGEDVKKSITRVNALHIIVSEKEVFHNKYVDFIRAYRMAKAESSNKEFRVTVKLRDMGSTEGVKYYIECLDVSNSDKEINSAELLSLIEKMTEASSISCRQYEVVTFNGLPFKLMVHNKANCASNDKLFMYAISFITDVMANMFNGENVRDDLDELANKLEIESKKHKDKVHAMLEERKKKDPNRKSRVLSEEEKEALRKRKKALDDITVKFNGL